MDPLECRRVIRAPVERVFALFSDFANAPRLVPSIVRVEILTPGVTGKGLRFRETRRMLGKEGTEEMEVTAFERGRSYTVGCTSNGFRFESRFDFEPVAEGTQVKIVLRAEAKTLAAKLMAPLGKMYAGTVKKCIEDDLDAVARIAESAESSGSAESR